MPSLKSWGSVRSGNTESGGLGRRMSKTCPSEDHLLCLELPVIKKHKSESTNQDNRFTESKQIIIIMIKDNIIIISNIICMRKP